MAIKKKRLAGEFYFGKRAVGAVDLVWAKKKNGSLKLVDLMKKVWGPSFSKKGPRLPKSLEPRPGERKEKWPFW
jgi:hypothetical protein